MNIDQSRSGGEGMISKADQKKKQQDGPPIFESADAPVKLTIPDGWKAKKEDQEYIPRAFNYLQITY